MTFKHLFRIATLVVPSALAWQVATAARPGELTDVVKLALGPLWVLLAGALALRTLGVVVGHWRGESAPILEQLDVLTASGSALAWLSAGAVMGAVWIGWASLAVVGLLGTGLLHVVVLLTFAAARGVDPMRSGSVSRRFIPEVATEGDDVIEELRFSGVRIPVGFKLFATGRIGPRWATSRSVLDSAESGAEVVLESEVGPALRGIHDPEPMTMWLQDVFGLCRSMRSQVPAARLTVLPRLRLSDTTPPVLDRGDGPRAPRAAARLPTEGSFNLREYQQGDDVRRIHWVQSLASRELVVRLPDELPPDRPRVRLVLDTFFPEAHAFACDAPAELLDSLVSVWLAVGRTLARSGARVTLVTARRDADRDELIAVGEELVPRAMGPALGLGALAEWQDRLTVEALLTDEPTLVVSRSILTSASRRRNVRWIVVPPAWVTVPDPWKVPSIARLPFPMGSEANRGAHRRRAQAHATLARRDIARCLAAMRGGTAPAPPESFLALPGEGGRICLQALP